MADQVVIDPQTGERITASSIDPATGERIATPQRGALGSFADASGLSALAHPIDAIMGIPGAVKQAGANISDAYSAVKSGGPDTAQRVARAVPILGPIAETMAGQAESGNYAGMVGTYLGGAAGILGPKVLKDTPFTKAATSAADTTASALKTVGDAAQDLAVHRVNKTVGSLQKDFDRGANPGAQYLQSGLGVSSSMKSIAAKAKAAVSEVGQKIGDAYEKASQNMPEQGPDFMEQPRLTGGNGGLLPGSTAAPRIPVQEVFDALSKHLKDAHDLESGFGGSGNTTALEAYAQRLAPELDKAVQRGGFTPKELFDLKQKLTSNINWKSTSDIESKLNNVRQSQYGALAGILDKYVPELAPLNKAYQSLKNLEERTDIRSKTGSEPLTNFKEKGIVASGGASVGYALGGPMGAAVGGGLGLAADTIPSKTAVAAGLYQGGKSLSTVGTRLEEWLRNKK